MPVITVTINGLSPLSKKLSWLEKNVQRGILRSALLEGARVVETHAKTSVEKEPKSGHIYRRGSMVHQASAPGEAPATDIGHLVGSIFVEPEGSDRVIVGVGAEYAVPLEFGTGKMAARPFMRPAVDNNIGEIDEAITQAVRSGIAAALH